MSDFKAIEISDILGLSKPLEKLLDCISSACGKIYEPKHIKRMAEAHAEEIKTLSDSLKDNPNLLIKYDKETLSIENNPIIERAKQRFLTQEIIKQNNIDNIVRVAACELNNETIVSDEPVDKTWLLRFFKSAEDITEDEIQILWGKVLAGEIKHPNSISLRTLGIIKNISRNEAILFNDIAKFALRQENSLFLPKYTDLLESQNIFYSNILKLVEIGLMTASITTFDIPINEDNGILCYNNNYSIQANSIGISKNIKIPVYLFTTSAQELFSIIKPINNNNLLKTYFEYLKENNKNFDFYIYKINKFDFEHQAIIVDKNPITNPDIL